MLRRLLALLTLSILVATIAPASAAPGDEFYNYTVTSRAIDANPIVITVFKPAAALTADVPVILDSHGWGGSRRKSIDGTVQPYLTAGIGVVSIDQRGHGESGGLRNVEDPQLEAQDIMAVIDYIATLDWVKLDSDVDGNPIAGDPVLGAIGGSYGGGYQTITALQEIAEEGETRFEALAPEITWYDLPTALAPNNVPRTAWITGLYGTAKAPANKVPTFIDQAFAWGAATGQWPHREEPWAAAEAAAGIPNMTTLFRSHSPRGFVEQGIKLNIPVIQRQGVTDNLFNMNEGLNIFEKALTPEARAKSVFTTYNGGHLLPGRSEVPTSVGSVFPLGNAPSGDPCNTENGGSWESRRLAFFTAAFSGGDTAAVAPTKYNLATDANTCLHLNSMPAADDAFDVDPTGFGYWGVQTGAGVPQNIRLANGPLTVAGAARITGDLYNFGADTRAFFALSIGTTAAECADAKVIQNNMMPLRSMMPQGASIDGTPFSADLAAVAADIPAGKSLCLTVSPVSDESFGHSSRTPGLMGFDGLRVRVPVVN
ncbi:MAG: type transport system ATP-binding protein [Actinomycetota bacterium]|jgi:pimeloyl-ACP methyl ester carboxylesterase|nr:type transport system ATP-binding protein [Actinomycetota bacterium]